MPRYDMKCTKCGEIIEYNLTFKEYAELEKAPFTHSNECLNIMKRVYTKNDVPSVKYKGPGFYSTDYKRKLERLK